MNLEELLGKIESDELKEAIVSIVNEEKQKGISKYSKKDKEVLKYKSALKEVGYDTEKYSDIDAFISDVNLAGPQAISNNSLFLEYLLIISTCFL